MLVDDLCRDYDELIVELENLEASEGGGSQRGQTQRDLLELAQKLEQELLVRLAKIDELEKG